MARWLICPPLVQGGTASSPSVAKKSEVQRWVDRRETEETNDFLVVQIEYFIVPQNNFWYHLVNRPDKNNHS